MADEVIGQKGLQWSGVARVPASLKEETGSGFVLLFSHRPLFSAPRLGRRDQPREVSYPVSPRRKIVVGPRSRRVRDGRGRTTKVPTSPPAGRSVGATTGSQDEPGVENDSLGAWSGPGDERLEGPHRLLAGLTGRDGDHRQ